MRAYDLLAHRIAAHFHVVTLAVVLGEAGAADQVIRETLRHLRYPLPAAATDPIAEATQAWVRQAEDAAIRRLLVARGLRPEDCLAPPAPPDPQSLTYCPRCETPYAVPSGVCIDCPGVVLHAYPPSASAPPPTVLSPRGIP